MLNEIAQSKVKFVQVLKMEESRRLLESHLNEFFAPTTGNERKRQIEVVLDNFSKQTGSWKQALYFLSHSSSNQFVTMYCLSVIENTIKCKWLGMSGGEKEELKATIYSFLMQNCVPSSGVTCPGFVRNKIIKLLVDVGKYSWPRTYPDFFSNILTISSSEETVGIGLMFIKTISEEYPNCKDEVSTERKAELKSLVLQQLPNVFELIQQILVSGLTQYASSVSASSPGQSPQPENVVITHFDEVLSLTLETVANLFTWMPLDGYNNLGGADQIQANVPFSEHFIKIICQYAHIDSCPHFRTKGGNLGILAMTAINELLYRKFIPKDFDGHMDAIALFGAEILKRCSNRAVIMSLPHQYLEKVIDFLCLIASQQFFRYDGLHSKDFVTHLLSFTFDQAEATHYYDCLEIWARLLDHLNAGVPFVKITLVRDDLIEYFKQPMLDLATKIVLSTQKFEIKDGDDTFETDEEEEETEAPSLSRNIDILVKIGELLPTESLEVVTSLWAESCMYYSGLVAHLDQTKTNIGIDDDMNIKHFIFIIQLVGRLASVFYGHFENLYEDVFKKQAEVGKNILHQLIKVMLCSKEYYFVKFPASIIQANCEIICSLKTWIYWLARYHSEVIQIEASEPEVQSFLEMINVCTEFVFFTLENRVAIDPSIVLAQVNFFNTLVNTLRTPHIFKMNCVRGLIEKLNTLSNSVDSDTYRSLHKVCAALILLPWQNASDQEWELRSKLYMDFMKNMSTDLFESANRPPLLVFWVQVLNDQLDMLMSECTNSKKICWNVMRELVPFVRTMVTQHLKDSVVNEQLLKFFIKVMEVLRQQVGAQFFEETIRLFLTLFSKGNIVQELMKESDTIVVEKFLHLLQFMVKDNSTSFKKFFGEALTLCYNNIYPCLAQRPTPELKIPFFQLIRDCVNYRWSYFFPSTLTKSKISGSAFPTLQQDQKPEEQNVEALNKLNQILQSIGHSFLQSDLEVFRFNLATLSLWNERHKLFLKLSDKQEYLDQFMTLFIQILIQKSHDLLREEIAGVLFEMASVNYERFCSEFLQQTLANNFSVLPISSRHFLLEQFSLGRNENSPSSSSNQTDLPTFLQSLNKFVDNLRYLHFSFECGRNEPVSSEEHRQEQFVPVGVVKPISHQ